MKRIRRWFSRLIVEAMRPELEKLAKFVRKELMNLGLITDALTIVKSAAMHTRIQQVKAQAEAIITGLEEHKYASELATIKSQASHLKDIITQLEDMSKQVNEAVEAAKAVTRAEVKAPEKPATAPVVQTPTPAPTPVTPITPTPTVTVQPAPAVVPTADTVASGTATEEPITSPGEPKIVK